MTATAILPRILVLLMLFCFGMSGSAAANEKNLNHPAAKFIDKMGNTAINSLTAKDIPSKEREKRVRSLLTSNFDVQTIGRFAMGTYWKTATEAEKADYLNLFEDMIVKTYAQRFAEYSGQDFKVAGAIDASEKDALVSSQIFQESGPPVNVEWRVRKKNGSMKVIDVIVEGISMSVTQRSDFASVIQKGDGRVSALLNTLRLRQNGAIPEKM